MAGAAIVGTSLGDRARGGHPVPGRADPVIYTRWHHSEGFTAEPIDISWRSRSTSEGASAHRPAADRRLVRGMKAESLGHEVMAPVARRAGA